MPIQSFRPLTPSGRFTSLNKQPRLSKERPQKGADRVEAQIRRPQRLRPRHLPPPRRRSQAALPHIDFKRDLLDLPAKVQAIEYDPNRSANLALLAYATGEKRYIIAPEGLTVGTTIVASDKAGLNDFTVGNNYPLSLIPPSTRVHAVELVPGRGAQIARCAGASLELVGVENDRAQLKMPSGEMRYVHASCRATIGIVGNGDHSKQSLGKAGRNRWLGRRPHVRGMAMNPVDHPNGGGQGKSKGGGGRQQLVSPWGQLAKGFPTRRRRKLSPARSSFTTTAASRVGKK